MDNAIEFELEATAELHNYNKWIAETFNPFTGGSLLEIGSGIGTFSHIFSDKFDDLTLVEPSEKLAKHLENRFADCKHISVQNCLLDTDFIESTTKKFDCALMVNVLEHIENDLDALKKLSNLLKPGGYLLIFVPALQSLYSDFDRLVGHHRRYHRIPLQEITKSAGFQILNLRYFDWLGASAWWFFNVILRKKSIDPNSAILYDKFGIPVTAAIESLIKPPFGKNLILVAQRKPDVD